MRFIKQPKKHRLRRCNQCVLHFRDSQGYLRCSKYKTILGEKVAQYCKYYESVKAIKKELKKDIELFLKGFIYLTKKQRKHLIKLYFDMFDINNCEVCTEYKVLCTECADVLVRCMAGLRLKKTIKENNKERKVKKDYGCREDLDE